jgi:hypothetical protein
MSSEVEFFDVLYLGIFIILSPAFDRRFHHGLKPPHSLVKEVAFATAHFHSLLHFFSQRFVIVLEGEVVSHSYVVDRMLGEFAAASVVLAKGIHELDGAESDDDAHDSTCSETVEQIEGILQKIHPDVFPYYLRCLDRGHNDFLWTGPIVQILPRSDAFSSVIPIAASGELLDLPSHQIYTEDLDPDLPILPDSGTHVGKRRNRGDSLNVEDEQRKKRSRQS